MRDDSPDPTREVSVGVPELDDETCGGDITCRISKRVTAHCPDSKKCGLTGALLIPILRP